MSGATGLFSEPAYISVGDDFDKKVAVPDRNRGGQFKTTPAKKGTGVDALFDKKVKSLSDGDKYVDPGVAEKRRKMEQAKKKITPEGFKYTNPGTKSTGQGADWGCFAKYNHESDRGDKKGKAKPTGPAPRNITTNPARKGTYGTPGTELGVGDEYKYVPDPYEVGQRRELQRQKDAAKKFIGGPFRAACKGKEFFDGHPNVAASKVYTIDRALPAKKPPKTVQPVVTVPFKPSSPPKRGLAGTLSRPLEYKEDPYEAKEKAARAERLKAKAAVTWKPVSGTRTMPVQSIAYNHIGRARSAA